MHLCEQIKALRVSKKLSRKEFANTMGITYWALAKYESGERRPDYDLLVKIALYFNVSVDYLLGNKHSEFVMESPNTYFAHSISSHPNITLIKEDYLKLAFEIQEAEINPESVRNFVEILKAERDKVESGKWKVESRK